MPHIDRELQWKSGSRRRGSRALSGDDEATTLEAVVHALRMPYGYASERDRYVSDGTSSLSYVTRNERVMVMEWTGNAFRKFPSLTRHATRHGQGRKASACHTQRFRQDYQIVILPPSQTEELNWRRCCGEERQAILAFTWISEE